MNVSSHDLYETAKKLMPGGVNSPVRAYEPYPFFTSNAKGSMIYDVDGHAYIDYCMAYGPLILGHAHQKVIDAVKRAAQQGYDLWNPHRRRGAAGRVGRQGISEY